MPVKEAVKIQQQQVQELMNRCEQNLKSARADLREGARDRMFGKCAALLYDARALAKAARRL